MRHAVVAGTSQQRKVKAMLHQLRTIRNDKVAKRKTKHKERMQEMIKRKAVDEGRRAASQKLIKRRRYALEGAKAHRAKRKMEAGR